MIRVKIVNGAAIDAEGKEIFYWFFVPKVDCKLLFLTIDRQITSFC